MFAFLEFFVTLAEDFRLVFTNIECNEMKNLNKVLQNSLCVLLCRGACKTISLGQIDHFFFDRYKLLVLEPEKLGKFLSKNRSMYVFHITNVIKNKWAT